MRVSEVIYFMADSLFKELEHDIFYKCFMKYLGVQVINVEFAMDLCNTLPLYKLQCFRKSPEEVDYKHGSHLFTFSKK